MKFLFPLLLALGIQLTASAQQPAASAETSTSRPTLPEGPLLRTAPEFSQWVTVFVYADEKKKESDRPSANSTVEERRPRKSTTTKTGNITHEEVLTGSGPSLDIWFEGNSQFTRHADKLQWFASGPHSNDGEARPLPANGFRDLTGVTPDNFAGTVPYSGGSYFVFIPGGAAKLDLSDAATAKSVLEKQNPLVLVDAESRLPVLQRDGEVSRTYRFNNPPSEMQSLPADLVALLKKGEEGRIRLQARAPRPY